MGEDAAENVQLLLIPFPMQVVSTLFLFPSQCKGLFNKMHVVKIVSLIKLKRMELN